MERRHFLKLGLGFAAGAAALAAGAVQAAPLPPRMPETSMGPDKDIAQPAVTSQDDVDRLAPEQVQWRRRYWRRRRYWGWRPRRRFWRRRYWRRRYW